MQKQIVRTQLNLNYDSNDARWHHGTIYVGDSYLLARPSGVLPLD